MVLEFIIQLFDIGQAKELFILTKNEACGEFAFRSPFSYDHFLSLVKLTSPKLNKFGLVRFVKDSNNVLFPLSDNNFTQAILEAVHQSSLEAGGRCPELQVCGWSKESSPELSRSLETKNLRLSKDGSFLYVHNCSPSSPQENRHTGVVGYSNNVSSQSRTLLATSVESGSVDYTKSQYNPKDYCREPFIDVFSVSQGQDHHYQTIGISKCRKHLRRSARFIKHVNFDDSAIIHAGAPFIKIWKVRNDSKVAWPRNSAIIHVGGESMIPKTAPLRYAVPCLNPGEERDIEIPLVAPISSGRFRGFYRFCSPDGKKFGQRLSCQVTVKGSNASFSESSLSDSCSSSSEDAKDKAKARDDCDVNRNIHKKQKKRECKLERKRRKLENRAVKLCKKLHRIEKKLWKLGRFDRNRGSGQEKLNGDESYPVAVPVNFQVMDNGVIIESGVRIDMGATDLEKGFKELEVSKACELTK